MIGIFSAAVWGFEPPARRFWLKLLIDISKNVALKEKHAKPTLIKFRHTGQYTLWTGLVVLYHLYMILPTYSSLCLGSGKGGESGFAGTGAETEEGGFKEISVKKARVRTSPGISYSAISSPKSIKS